MEKEKKDYAEEYLLNYLKYYDSRSISCKKWYLFFVVLDTVISAFIPFTALFIDTFAFTQYIIAFMGSVITIVSTLNTTFGFHKNWVEYRTTAEILKYHKYLYETDSSPYDGDNKEKLLISGINSIVEKENRNWRSIELNTRKNPPQTNKSINA